MTLLDNATDMTENTLPPTSKIKWKRHLRYSAIGMALLAFAGVYFFKEDKQIREANKGCPSSDATAALKPFATGEVAAFSVAQRLQEFPSIAFNDADGQTLKLSAFRGKTVLINLWATWCVPCRKEMPALDRLQAELGGQDFEVIAISVDTGGAEKPRKWLKDNGITNLRLFSDQDGAVLKTLQRSGHVVGLPTTILLTPEGCQAGILRGAAEWASEDAFKLIKAALGQSQKAGVE